MILTERIHVMIHLASSLQQFTPPKKPVSDPAGGTGVVLCLLCHSKERVDDLVAKAVAVGGRAGHPHPTRLTPDEPYTHLSMWSLLGVSLLRGCDLEKLDPFTPGLLTHDEVRAVDQDALCQPRVRVPGQNGLEVYAKPLEDGSTAVGFFNRNLGDDASLTVTWSDLKLTSPPRVRNLRRQKDSGTFAQKFTAAVASHGGVLVRIFSHN